MSMHNYGDSAYEIPLDTLRKHLPESVAHFEDMEDQSDLTDEVDAETFAHVEKVKEWGKSLGLELGIGYRNIEDENPDDLPCWYVFCENAVTINPAFTALGGELIHWSTFG